MADKRYYWIKLKTDFFSKKEIDFLLAQKNGCEYIVLYQMLCLITANNDGEMATRIGEMIVPYDIEKIVRDTKYFDTDTVVVALELFKKLGLVYEEDNKTLTITGFNEMVGTETEWAKKKRIYREKQKLLQQDNVGDNVREEYRDKRLEYRDKIIDKEIYKEKEKENKKTKVFTPPTLEEIENYCKERKNNVNAKKFYDYFTISNWVDSKGNKVKNWKQKVITWESHDKETKEVKQPEWFNKDIKDEKASEQEQRDIEKLLEEMEK